MILKTDRDIKIEIPRSMMNNEELRSNTPVSSMLDNPFYLKEVGLHAGTLKTILLNVDLSSVKTILDAMCGVGIAVEIFHKYVGKAVITVNDWDYGCYRLVSQRKHVDIGYNLDIDVLLDRTSVNWDLIYLDFNTFTLRNQKWLDLLKEYWKRTNQYLLFTDTANFGFRFPKNLISYEVKTPEEYYNNLSEKILENGSGQLSWVAMHAHAAIVCLSKRKRRPFAILEAEPLTLSKELEGGLFGS